MTLGTLYGIGIGPGDPELITLKAVKVLARTRHVFVPSAETAGVSLALSIARQHLRDGALVRELVFPMVSDAGELERRWDESARQVAEVLQRGEDASFLTLGDPMLYSTYIYLLRALRRRHPTVPVSTIPGITAMAAAAALSSFPLGEGRCNVAIVPVAENLDEVRRALTRGGTVVLMKVGRALHAVIDLLIERRLEQRAVFVARAGLDGERIETDLIRLRNSPPDVGYLSIILVAAGATAGERS